MSHTPTPWSRTEPVRAIKDGPDAYDTAIVVTIEGKKRIIAECFGRISENVYVDSRANAAFIVEACNAHERLLKAAKEAVQWVPWPSEDATALEKAIALAEGVKA